MKKGAVIICSLLLIVFLSMGFVSANWFTDFFGKITGHVIQGPTNGLVAYYSFDGSANDASGNNDGTWVGTSSYTTGKLGQAASLDPSRYIRSSIHYSDKVTVALWAKLSNGIFYVSKVNDSFSWGNIEYYLSIDSGSGSETYVGVGTDSGLSGITSRGPSAGNDWHHWVMTLADGTLSWYEDGNLLS